jgi:hypothetical protein
MIHKSAHLMGKRQKWTGSNGHTYHLRSHTNAATVYAMTSAINWNGSAYSPNYPDTINLKFHSSQTWRSSKPSEVRASNELHLTREDASSLLALLMAAITDFDQEKGKPS